MRCFIKKILIVSFHFSPENVIAAVRPTKLGKYLSYIGYEVDVVYRERKSKTKDELLQSDLINYKNLIQLNRNILLDYILDLIKFIRNHKNISGKFIGDMKQKKGSIFRLFRFFSFSINLFDQFFYTRKVLKSRIGNSHYDVVFSTYGPISSHYIGRKLKKKHPRSLWIADFRDPAAQITVPKIYSLLMKNYGNNVCDSADIITVVNTNMVNKLFLNENNLKKVQYLPNGFDLEDLRAFKANSILFEKSSKFRFTFTGTIYSEYIDFSPLFNVIIDLIENAVIKKEDIEFCYAGNDYELLLSISKKYNLSEILKYFGQLNRIESLLLQGQSDILIFIGKHTEEVKMTTGGKLFEYMLVGKPILSIIQGNLIGSDSKRILDGCEIGFTYEEANHEEDYTLMYSFLEKLVINNGCLPIHGASQCDAYNYKNIADVLDNLIRNHKLEM